jgi:hypothetical protein
MDKTAAETQAHISGERNDAGFLNMIGFLNAMNKYGLAPSKREADTLPLRRSSEKELCHKIFHSVENRCAVG